MPKEDRHLKPDEIAEFVIPITKLFCKIFDSRKGLMASDVVNINTSIVTSIIASCISSSTKPTDEAQFKVILEMTIALLIATLDGSVPYDHNGRLV